jgi:uncharacterized Ntn-hydrolase superfamily protein
VAVQTCTFGVGSIVPWAEPGVGAVATQSFAEVSFGPRGLALMRSGGAPADVLGELLEQDDGRDLRQLGLVDAEGRSAAHTGTRCVPAAGHLTTDDASVQANMMERDTVWPAMLDAYRNAAGDLADRLLSSLRAAEAEGGDIRGRQSAALLVVPGGADAAPWARRLDLRVEDHAAPLDELERLVRMSRAYSLLARGGDLARDGRFEESAETLDQAARLAPDDPQVAFWHGLGLAGVGRVDEAREEMERARAANPRFARFLRRFPASGMLPDMPELFDALLPLDGS